MVTVTKYATTVESLEDTRFQSTDWTGLSGASSSNNLYASAQYKKGYTPKQLYCHDFKFDVPNNAVIQNIRYEVKIKGENISTTVPMAYYFWFNGLAHLNPSDGDGIYGGMYSTMPPNFPSVSSSWNVFQYDIDRKNIEDYKMPMDRVNVDSFGVILLFGSNWKNTEGTVYVEWIRCTVEYEVAEFSLEIRGNVSDNETNAISFKKSLRIPFNLTYYIHKTNYVSTDPITVDIDIPVGISVDGYSGKGVTFNPQTYKATFDFTTTSSPYITFEIEPVTTGLKKVGMTYGDAKLHKYFYVDTPYAVRGDDDRLTISSSDVRRWSESCFHFVATAISEDDTVGYNVFLDGNVSNELVGWKFDDVNSSNGVSMTDYCTNNYAEFTVPPNTEVKIAFTGCFLPKTTGNKTLRVVSEDTGNEWTYNYTSLPPYTYVFNLLNHDILWSYPRLVSQVDTGAYVYPVGVSEYDDTLIVDPCSLQMEKTDDIDYIGCVPLKQTHFDPKSTYKDTLLNTTYKNKRYMGKKGASDETITLDIRLPPRDVTTIQGLIDMDKPVPINTNHLAFEGDSLNHRGWVELYGITTEQTGNNPHWYKCDLSVKYITHNLNSRFLINRGSKVSDYFLPELLIDKHEYGDDLKNSFLIECTGGYTYSASQVDYHKRNYFGLPSQKKVILRALEPLSVKSEVSFNWYTSRNVENAHNKISHIVRLIDSESGNAVLEYEYYDIDFTQTNKYSCRVICRVLYKGAYKTVLNRRFLLNSDAEFDSTQAGEIDVYGSEIIFKIVNGKVSIQDCGFSGKELFVEDIPIQDGQYYFDVEIKNNNVENDAPDILNYLDVSIKELDLSSKYSNYYGNVLVSPFPVPNKKIVFTRECDEGTIYYLEDDGTECSYMLNPYYSYKCGVDMQSRDGISIFNIDNNYKTIYITNGLVKLGINRYNGKVTLHKYDKHSKEFILTNHLQLTKYEDINVNSYSDDKVELQASDSIFTIWRGRPYIHIAHETEDILLTDKWVKIYSEGVGDDVSETPQLWNLIDTTNLLPSKIASNKGIDDKVWNISSDNTSMKNGTASITLTTNGGLASESVFTSSHTDSTQTELMFLVDGSIVPKTADNKLEYQFMDAGVHSVQAVYYKDNSYTVSSILSITIEDNAYKITPTFPSSMHYLENDFTCTLTYGGEPVSGETVVFYVNGLSYPKLTDSQGVARLNNRLFPREQLIDPNIETGDVEENQSQDDSYIAQSIPYTVVMTYSEEGEVLAKAEKDALVLKGNLSVSVNSTTITRGNPITFTFTNGLDPSRDDIEQGEQYPSGKVVVLSINGVEYPRVLGANGQASLTIRLNAGLYDLKVFFAGDNQYNGFAKNYEVTVVENS